MTTSAWSQLEPCCNQCNDCGWGCKDKCNCNIVSANPECLRVDVEECGKIVLDPVCPPVVIAGENVTVEEIPCEEWEHCSVKYEVSAECVDEKVKVCSSDTAGFLADKFEEGFWVKIDPKCEWKNSKIKISVDEDIIPTFDAPPIIINNSSRLINATVWGSDDHAIYISDKEVTTYDNNVCIGFRANQDKSMEIEASTWNSREPVFVEYRDICTWNRDLAERGGIRIKESWYYRLFWQLTVECNTAWPDAAWLNLWRWLLRIDWSRFSWQNIRYLSTAKHWWYNVSTMLTWGRWINIDTNGVISIDGGYAPEWWGSVSFWWWSWIQTSKIPWPWMTFNMDCFVDLYKDELITVWFRWQSSMEDSATGREISWFKFVWQNDSSTQFNALFWWTILGVQMISPKLFQQSSQNKIYTVY